LVSTEKWRSSRNISLYLNMPSEVSTSELLQLSFQEKKSVFIPRYSETDMEMVEIHSMEDYNCLPVTSWKIKQPLLTDGARKTPSFDNGGLDLIIVPGLAFTKSGIRLGRGKGYYDKYLHEYRTKFNKLPYLVALAFNEQIVDEIPTTDRDVKVDMILSADCCVEISA
ncbi:hypothetical protein HELRODRAFT_69587, partial [Helobdella robusta]|uniref:5-formyltetrahydrofolate cyclo-ligase n=1 Tax=Helobdella robusta TaxID=6412 RepID=T1FZW8_HELRO